LRATGGRVSNVTPLVSVVIPTYNRATDLKRALTSVLRQTWQHWEALVVDNHSTDNTREVLESFQDRRIRLVSVHNKGVIAISRNFGVANSTGSYLAFLDSDDWWTPTKLADSVQRCEAGADLVYHDLYLVWSRRQRIYWRRRRTRALSAPAYDDLILKGNAICNSSVVVRRDVFARIGGFSEDPSLVAWEDYDAWLRIAKITERFERLARPLGYYWIGGGNMTSAERTLRIFPRVRELYFALQGERCEDRLPAWYHYGLGLAHYELGSYALSLQHMRHALPGPLPVWSRSKALFTLTASSVRVLVGAKGAQE